MFERLPVPWVWWPALGGLVVGLVGWFAPRTLGVGYDNITQTLDGSLAGTALLFLVVMKLLSWSISLGSGTSGGTLAPLLTIGGGLGGVLGGVAAALLPQAGIDPRMAALVGMASLFSGAARALLTSVLFAFEATLQPAGIVPLLGGCTAAFLVSSLLMPNTIMTEKIVRRGVRVPSDYEADYLARTSVAEAMTGAAALVTLAAEMPVAEAQRFLRSDAPQGGHQGYPVVVQEEGEDSAVVGVVTRRDLFAAEGGDIAGLTVRDRIRRPLLTIAPEQSLREAADRMLAEDVGRLVVMGSAEGEGRSAAHRMVGILTRGDLLRAHRPRLHEAHSRERHLVIRLPVAGKPPAPRRKGPKTQDPE
jgi:Chloride channel protein EriC